MNSESGKLPPPMCLHPNVVFRPESDNYYCTTCQGGMGLAYYKAARERDALKTTLTNLSNAAAILHGQSPDSTAKAMVGAELGLAEKALK